MQTSQQQIPQPAESGFRFALVALAALGGDVATRRMHHNDMPPLPGRVLALSLIRWPFAFPGAPERTRF